MTRRGTGTTVARQIVAKSADEEYKSKGKDIDAIMKRLHKALAKQDKDQKKSPADWGWVGNNGHVYAELVDLVEFLNG